MNSFIRLDTNVGNTFINIYDITSISESQGAVSISLKNGISYRTNLPITVVIGLIEEQEALVNKEQEDSNAKQLYNQQASMFTVLNGLKEQLFPQTQEDFTGVVIGTPPIIELTDVDTSEKIYVAIDQIKSVIKSLNHSYEIIMLRDGGNLRVSEKGLDIMVKIAAASLKYFDPEE